MTLWTVASQALLSMGFFRQEYWSGLPFTSLEDLSHLQRLLLPTFPPRMELLSLALQADSLLSGPSLIAQLVKNHPAMQETWVQSLGQEDPLDKEIAAHSSILA